MATLSELLEVTSAEVPQVDPYIGSVLGQYRIDRRLGSGGMGTVYEGVQLSVDRPVAVKVIAGDADRSPDFVARFRREAQAMARLRHPNTVRLLDFGVTEQSRMYMVMELLRGFDLETRLGQSGPLELTAALRIVRQVAQSLSEAHAIGIVHRDLKPGNIFLAEVEGGDCFVKVMDFGVAGFQHDGQHTTITMKGAVLGTAAYMSPEQAQGYEVDGRADLYSLGVILFEMLTGRPPFVANTAVSLLLLHVSEPPPRVLEICPNAPELSRVQSLLDRLLAKEPEARIDSAAELISVIDGLLLELGAAISGPSGIDTTPRMKAVRRKPWAGALMSLVLIAAGALFIWQGVRDSDAGDPHARTEWQNLEARGRVLASQSWDWLDHAVEGFHRSTSVSVTIATVPTGATVSLGGAELGTTPYPLQLKAPTAIELSLPGHAEQTVTIDPAGDPNVVIKLVPLPPYRGAMLPPP
ncbi:MAG TPA: protein kinase [Polyangiales bacterium]|jgi:serine/threonine-protein kinase|nr:protein kinase [Polyangiales bacterium]